ncbi:hypothetical protein F5Y18DRAFT_435201 [Xylariaceae sp. FL1019]|nr:hypothetical protein F5Y18DRAFT_435201 [Xylariaceae sp. FL1019]
MDGIAKDNSESHRTGLFATRDLSRGSLLLTEAPILISTAEEGIKEMEDYQGAEASAYARKFDQLSAEDQANYLTLTTTRSSTHRQSRRQPTLMDADCNQDAINRYVQDKIQHKPELNVADEVAHYTRVCNILDIYYVKMYAEREDGCDFGVFLNSSMINHSCTPNASEHFDGDSGLLKIFAMRDIPAGEEITVGRIDLVQTREERHNDLGYTCGCPTCRFPYPKVSDQRRARLQQIFDVLDNSCLFLQPKHVTVTHVKDIGDGNALAIEYMKLLQKEGLVGVALTWCWLQLAAWANYDDKKALAAAYLRQFEDQALVCEGDTRTEWHSLWKQINETL